MLLGITEGILTPLPTLLAGTQNSFCSLFSSMKWLDKKKRKLGGSPGLVVMGKTHVQEVTGSNLHVGYLFDKCCINFVA